MNSYRVLTLAAIFLASTITLYISGGNHRLRQTRVFVTQARTQSDAEFSQLSRSLQAACPELIRANLEWRADYTLVGRWGSTGWTVVLTRNGEDIFLKQGNSDAVETLRQTCAALHADEREMADSNAHTAIEPTGRYALRSAGADHVFLVDTKTGAVWTWYAGDKLSQEEFKRISVEGLYDDNPEIAP